MENNRKVPIKNILYMFSYIWDKAETIDFALKDNNDDFDSPNILAKLFIENIKDILKIGIYREYKAHTEEIKGIKGKIDFKESMNKLSFENAKAVCEYDNYDENYLELLDEVGLEVVDVNYGIVGDYFESKSHDTDMRVGVVVNIGYGKTEIAIFNKGIMIRGTTILITNTT